MKYLAVLFLVLSCSTLNRNKEFSTVEIDRSNSEELLISNEQLENQDYGPKLITSEIEETRAPRYPLVGLSVYSTLYSSLALVDYLRESEKLNIKYSGIAANGFASVIAALYAKEKSVSYLEWKLFELLKKLKEYDVFSKPWYDYLEVFLDREFKDLTLQQLKTLLIVYSDLPEKNLGGKVSSALISAVKLSNKNSFFLKPNLFDKAFMEYGIDINHRIAFFPSKTRFKYLSDFNSGVYTNYLSFLQSHHTSYVTISGKSSQAMDEMVPISDINENYKEATQNQLKEFLSEIKLWQEENAPVSN